MGKIGTYAYHSSKHAEAVAAGDVDRLGRFMHGILHRNDHWGKVSEEARGKVWTDSPSGHYSNFSNLGLISQPISLAGTQKPELAFDLRHDLEPEADFLHVEARPQNGQWTTVERLTGRSDWREHRLDLSGYQNQTVELRFRVQTDASQTGEGCFLDRVRVERCSFPSSLSAATWTSNKSATRGLNLEQALQAEWGRLPQAKSVGSELADNPRALRSLRLRHRL
ncbi:hypothetical protein DYH09_10495 [bacterium CPR1]|nr:hypothetical protein [bacterium CPR1]